MKLYHFCGDSFLDGIQRYGLTRGRICWFEGGHLRIVESVQWLTANPSRDQQEWCNPQYSRLPYDRCANRLTVAIPKAIRDKCRKWTSAGPMIVPPDQYELLSAFGDPESYYCYFGNIPASWIRGVDRLGARWGTIAGEWVKVTA